MTTEDFTDAMDVEPTIESFPGWFNAHCEQAREQALRDLRTLFPDSPAVEKAILLRLDLELEALRERWLRYLTRTTH